MSLSAHHTVHRLRYLALNSPPASSLFYARLWHALIPGTETEHESLHVLALAFLATDQPYCALHKVRDLACADDDDEGPDARVLRRRACHGCAVIVARCCEKLGRYTEAIKVMDQAMKRSTPMPLPQLNPGSTSSSAHLLVARMSHKGKAPEHAVEQYHKALQDDPWLWEAFTGLCDIGCSPAPGDIFPDPIPSKASSSRSQLVPPPVPRQPPEIPGFGQTRKQLSPLINGPPTLPGGLFTPEIAAGQGAKGGVMGNNWDHSSIMADSTFPAMHDPPSVPQGKRNILSSFTASATSILPSLRSNQTPTNLPQPMLKPPAMKRPRAAVQPRKAIDSSMNGHLPPLDLRPFGKGARGMEVDTMDQDSTRRSTRLKAAPPPVKQVPKMVPIKDRRPVRSRSATSSNSGAATEIPSPPRSEAKMQEEADSIVRGLVRACALAYRALSLYRCAEAREHIDCLPPEVQASPWALDIIARSFYEQTNYVLAQRAFRALLAEEPYRLQGIECYSTLLWHLADPPSLSHIAQQLIAVDREAPQPWIAAGNTFSLQRDHDEAMRCFRRATQVAPGFAYAWTLCGYEAMEMEEYERAISFYRTAIRTDARHYNAWYGMGLVYLKTSKVAYAGHHFRRAAEINPTNPVLWTCIGMVHEQQEDLLQALGAYEEACKHARESPMVQYKRIRMLVALQRIDEAIAALEPLVRQAPDEANIHFLLGKCYLRVDRRPQATVCFASARELNPKLEGPIKSALLGKEEGEESGDEEVDI